jgi:hypothetical protein
MPLCEVTQSEVPCNCCFYFEDGKVEGGLCNQTAGIPKIGVIGNAQPKFDNANETFTSTTLTTQHQHVDFQTRE